MERMNLAENIIQVEDKKVVYYTADDLVSLVENNIKKNTNVELNIFLDTFNLYSLGVYNFFIKNYDSLNDEDKVKIIDKYGDPDDSYSVFTDSIIESIYESYAMSGYYNQYNRRSSHNGLLIPVYFENDRYSRFVKKIMQG